MTLLVQRLNQFIKKQNFSWVFVAFLIFAAFLIFDSTALLLDRTTGRKTGFRCDQNSLAQTTCTVTIYGFLGNYQQSFPADKFDWVGNSPVPGGATCGLDIWVADKEIRHPYSKRIMLVYPNQDCKDARLTRMTNQINDLFQKKPVPSSAEVFYDGLNSGFAPYVLGRIGLIILGLVGFWFYPRGRRRASEAGIRLPEPSRKTFGKSIFSWWRMNTLVRAFFYLYFFACGMIGFILEIIIRLELGVRNMELGHTSPYVFINYASTSIGPLLSIYPMIAMLTLQAFIQWRQLKQKPAISAWWVFTPMLAMLPLLFIPSAALSYLYHASFQMISGNTPFSRFWSYGVGQNYAFFIKLAYFFLLGWIQWFVLRRKLSHATGWILIPLLNLCMLVCADFLVNFHSMYGENIFFAAGFGWAGIILWFILLGLNLGVQDLVSSIFMVKILRANAVE